MGMGYAAAFADVIEEQDLRNLCGEALSRFLASVEEKGCELPAVARALEFGEEVEASIEEAWLALQEEFAAVTGGLTLGINHHDSADCGDRYDEVDGVYWYIEGMYQLTPAGERLGDRVRCRSWVQFG